MSAPRPARSSWPADLPPPIDVILDQGDAESLAAARRFVASNLAGAVELAETLALLETCRGDAIAPSARLHAALSGLQARALRQTGLRLARPTWPLWTAFASAATVALSALLIWDPLRPEDPLAAISADLPVRTAPAAGSGLPLPTEVEPSPFDGQRVATAADRSAADSRTRVDLADDPLGSWIRPGNSLNLLRVDFELRASADLRRRAQADRGGVPEVDERVQRLADGIRADLERRLADAQQEPIAIAGAIRALLASGTAGPGGRHADALAAGADCVLAALPRQHGGELAVLLATAIEVAASTGRGIDLVAQHGDRLVVEHRQGIAGLLSPDCLAAWLGEAGRFLAWAPALGVDPGEAGMLRVRLHQSLQERRRHGERPEVLAAIAYGFGDLLAADEHVALERRLRGWKIAALVPDFAAMHQLAWSRRPGAYGFTRFQLELRRVAALATPATLPEQSALCLCLATNFAAPGVSGLFDVAAGAPGG
ncbi:MAG: hypothetical protein IPK26_15030 [Planctomycetes bacterium]|nr:hypothetical protein [Planctomycetota bacterium]